MQHLTLLKEKEKPKSNPEKIGREISLKKLIIRREKRGEERRPERPEIPRSGGGRRHEGDFMFSKRRRCDGVFETNVSMWVLIS